MNYGPSQIKQKIKTMNTIAVDDPYLRKRITVKDSNMAFIDSGEGDPIVFNHGNPTISYECRNVIPHLEARGRCIAPDLIGMRESDRLSNTCPDSYTLGDHIDYTEGFWKLWIYREK